jgi:hypothetical protein
VTSISICCKTSGSRGKLFLSTGTKSIVSAIRRFLKPNHCGSKCFI